MYFIYLFLAYSSRRSKEVLDTHQLILKQLKRRPQGKIRSIKVPCSSRWTLPLPSPESNSLPIPFSFCISRNFAAMLDVRQQLGRPPAFAGRSTRFVTSFVYMWRPIPNPWWVTKPACGCSSTGQGTKGNHHDTVERTGFFRIRKTGVRNAALNIWHLCNFGQCLLRHNFLIWKMGTILPIFWWLLWLLPKATLYDRHSTGMSRE